MVEPRSELFPNIINFVSLTFNYLPLVSPTYRQAPPRHLRKNSVATEMHWLVR